MAVELHNLVLRGDGPTGPELIANNAIHAGVVRSPGIGPPPAGTVLDLALEFDGASVDAWSNRRWPDDALSALPWLVRELARHGHRLEVGQLVLVGGVGTAPAPAPPRPRRRWRLPRGPGRRPPAHRTGRGRRRTGPAATSAARRVAARSEMLGLAQAHLHRACRARVSLATYRLS